MRGSKGLGNGTSRPMELLAPTNPPIVRISLELTTTA